MVLHNCQRSCECAAMVDVVAVFFSGLLFLLLNFNRNQGVILIFVFLEKSGEFVIYALECTKYADDENQNEEKNAKKYNRDDDENEAYNNMNNHIKRDFIH